MECLSSSNYQEEIGERFMDNKNMKHLIAILLLIQVGYNSYSQEREDYPSKEEIEYKKLNKPVEFAPISKDYIKSLKYSYISLFKSPNLTNPFISVWERTHYKEYYDSLRSICYQEARKRGGYGDGGDSLFVDCSNSVWGMRFIDRIGNIEKYDILRYDSLKLLRVILYHDHQLEFNHEDGYWISISNNGGYSWKNYYTGLTANNFFYIKPKSTLNLIVNDTTIQVEAALIRNVIPERQPAGMPEYEVVEDNLVMKLDLTQIERDKDNDGLTDILENKLFTNPLSDDSDSDGSVDSLDNNPIYEDINDKFSALYLHLLEHPLLDSIVPFEGLKYEMTGKDSLENKETFLVITNDNHLRHVSNTRNKYIFITNEEYKEYQKMNIISLPQLYVSPLFPVDGIPHYFKITIKGLSWRLVLLVIENEDHWTVRKLKYYIS